MNDKPRPAATILAFARGDRPLPKPKPSIFDEDYVDPDRRTGPPTFPIMDWDRQDLHALRVLAEGNPVHIDDFRDAQFPEYRDDFARRMAPQVKRLPNHYYVSLMVLYGGPPGFARELKVVREGARRKVNPAFAWELALLVGFDPNNTNLDTYGGDPENGLGRSISYMQKYGAVTGPGAPPPAPRRSKRPGG